MPSVTGCMRDVSNTSTRAIRQESSQSFGQTVGNGADARVIAAIPDPASALRVLGRIMAMCYRSLVKVPRTHLSATKADKSPFFGSAKAYCLGGGVLRQITIRVVNCLASTSDW